jgi:hypothetical protein
MEGKMRKEANSIHLGKDEDGYYFSFVDKTTGLFESVQLNQDQVLLLMRQVSELVYRAGQP